MKSVLKVGMDVHKDSVTLAIYSPGDDAIACTDRAAAAAAVETCLAALKKRHKGCLPRAYGTQTDAICVCAGTLPHAQQGEICKCTHDGPHQRLDVLHPRHDAGQNRRCKLQPGAVPHHAAKDMSRAMRYNYGGKEQLPAGYDRLVCDSVFTLNLQQSRRIASGFPHFQNSNRKGEAY